MKTILLTIIFFSDVCFGSININFAKDKGKTEFLAVGNPGFMKIKGNGTGPVGQLKIEGNKINGKLILDLSTLDTGMKLRNQHMKEKYLKVSEFPQATLSITDQPIRSGWTSAQPTVPETKLQAKLHMHNQEQPVEVTYSIDDKGQMTAKFEIKISDFKIDIPSFMGVTVADKVSMQVESTIKSEI